MNKRKWKKYAKKAYCKSWYVSRYNKIVQEAKEYAIVFLDMSPFGICVRITDSKRGNLKHPLNVRTDHTVKNLQPAFSGGHWSDTSHIPRDIYTGEQRILSYMH